MSDDDLILIYIRRQTVERYLSGGSDLNFLRQLSIKSIISSSDPLIIILKASLIIARHGAGVEDFTASMPITLSLGSEYANTLTIPYV